MTAAPSIRAPRRKNRELMRRLLRLLISFVITLVLVDFASRRVSATLHGKSDVVDHPLSVNFNVNRHLDAFYLTAFIGPAMFIAR